MSTKILLVEDDIKLAQFIEMELSCEGYEVVMAHNGLDGLTQARQFLPDLIILDWMIPGLSGVEICRRLRATGHKMPILIVTARDDIRDRVVGLDAGADDYVIKPFSIEELLARIRSHIRRTKHEEIDVLHFEDLSLNRRTREVMRSGKLIELTVREFDLLQYLLIHPHQVMTRDQILEKVWGYDFNGDSNIIEVFVRTLRQKLEMENSTRLIQTVRGVGYVLRLHK
ncbi:response regulator with CheY-like receiver domain and winged-helix DNA-binding domain [Synechococcus sp. PCC 7502]|uniref:response regulator transcription factor n=1 Tax=Synechococcus sp. PCC 7502 TaxID=1173263 RepID=UPI00029FDB9E|nr:response regulator transcription factor [Synechococcus sp. PCC 7502]AFY75099.1 response regulator with CheY-like receiver domain and winged-helix DNA-binding domain [Synechococcus sp. PCC 7502]